MPQGLKHGYGFDPSYGYDLARLQHRLQSGLLLTAQQQRHRVQALASALPPAVGRALRQQQDRWQRQASALALLDPQLVLQRGYAYLSDEMGNTVSRTKQHPRHHNNRTYPQLVGRSHPCRCAANLGQ